MSEYKIKQSIAYTDNQDGTPVCGDCGIQIGERADTCTNCALYEREMQSETFKQALCYWLCVVGSTPLAITPAESEEYEKHRTLLTAEESE